MSFDPSIQSLAERWRALRVKTDHVSLYTKIPAPTLSRVLNGQLTLDAGELSKISIFVDAAEELVRRCGAALDWRDHCAVRPLLDKYEQELKNPPAEPSEEDLDIFRRFIADEPLEEIAILYRLDRAEILRRIELVNLRSERLSRKAVAVERQ